MSENAQTQPALETLADQLQQLLGTAFKTGGPAGKQVKNFLNGVWLGHALHPVLTDVPVGSWMLAGALDLLSGANDDSKLAAGADAAIGIGILGALGAAVTGLTDWSDTYGAERRTGLIHMLLNTGALSGFTLSWLIRRSKGPRKLAVLISTASLGVASFSAYLGGEMVFELGTMVNHNAWTEGPGEWTPVLGSADLPDNTPYRAMAGETKILLVRQGGQVYALSEVCPHAGGPLSEGQLEGDSIICPWHGSRFCLKDGKVLDGPSTYNDPSYEVRENNGQIEVKLAKSHS